MSKNYIKEVHDNPEEYLKAYEKTCGTMQEEFDRMMKHKQEIDSQVMQMHGNSASSNVNHPSHYNTNNPVIILTQDRIKRNGNNLEIPIECIDVIRDMPVWKGNAIKYLWREGLKKDASLSDKEKEIEDCKKAIWYINDHIKQLENGNKS